MGPQLARSLQLLEQLPRSCRNVFKWFLLLTETPRPSFQTEPIQTVLKAVARSLQAELEVDAAGNLRLRKPATPGYENVPGIVMQGHYDMVCTRSESSSHNFSSDPLQLVLTGDVLSASGTTLGADNGIGLSAAFALFEEPGICHGPLEILCTANEESDMSGAENLAPSPFLQGTVLYNLDTEEENAICIGCAGGLEHTLDLPFSMSVASDVDTSRLSLSVGGLKGGHTGIDIDKGLANAILVMARLLDRVLSSGFRLSLESFSGGNAVNAIPSACTCSLVVASTEVGRVEAVLLSGFDDIKAAFSKVEGIYDADRGEYVANMRLAMSSGPLPSEGVAVVYPSELRRIVDLCLQCPHGVVSMSPDVDGLVETSVAFSLASLGPTSFRAHLFGRSSSERALDDMSSRIAALARLSGAADSGPFNRFPGWQPDRHSPALAVLKETHADILQKEPRIYAVHAGLECGFILRRYPQMDCVSFGPQIEGAHSIEERVFVSTVSRFWDLLKHAVQRHAVRFRQGPATDSGLDAR